MDIELKTIVETWTTIHTQTQKSIIKLEDKVDKLEESINAIKLLVVDKLNALPCAVHKERMKVYETHIEDGKSWRLTLVGVIVALVLEIIVFANMYGALDQKVNHHVDKHEIEWVRK